jgi:UDP-N-acetyl-D-mannosaminuronate dehydrogenase
MKIAPVGLDYVALPLGIDFARANVAVFGLDIDAGKVDSISPYIEQITPEAIDKVGIWHDIFTCNRSREKIRLREWRK